MRKLKEHCNRIEKMQAPFSEVELGIASGMYSTRTVIIGSIKDRRATVTHTQTHRYTPMCLRAQHEYAYVVLLLIVRMRSEI